MNKNTPAWERPRAGFSFFACPEWPHWTEEEISEIFRRAPAEPWDSQDFIENIPTVTREYVDFQDLSEYDQRLISEECSATLEWLCDVGALQAQEQDDVDLFYSVLDPNIWRLHLKAVFWVPPAPDEIEAFNAEVAVRKSELEIKIEELKRLLAECES